jgi:hypothetical protein
MVGAKEANQATTKWEADIRFCEPAGFDLKPLYPQWKLLLRHPNGPSCG